MGVELKSPGVLRGRLATLLNIPAFQNTFAKCRGRAGPELAGSGPRFGVTGCAYLRRECEITLNAGSRFFIREAICAAN